MAPILEIKYYLMQGELGALVEQAVLVARQEERGVQGERRELEVVGEEARDCTVVDRYTKIRNFVE